MKQTQLIVALFVTAMVKSTCAIGFEWQPEADVELPGNAVVHPPNGLRRVQATTDLSDAEFASSASVSGSFASSSTAETDAELASSSSVSSSSASAATSTAETEPPTTIMVLLPDNLSPSYSGSGSVMFFDGSVGDGDKSKSASAGSDSVADEASSAAAERTLGMATALTAFTILTALAMA